jgi:Mlc titration factor MtfA (ptsG expression regulator)
MVTFLLVCVFFIAGYRVLLVMIRRKPPQPVPAGEISHEFLSREVLFYLSLDPSAQQRFRSEMSRFLGRVHVTGVETEVTDADRWLVAASAVIPIFHFPAWEDYPLEEVLLYADAINLDFETNSPDSTILGMVGTGRMEGKMALSRKALTEGFQNKTDKHNTAIHEFIHLVDKTDGLIDGVPGVLMDRTYALPWLQLIRSKIADIQDGRSDIHEYGGTNLSEFFAVAGEYFFERPDLLKIKHPELYALLQQMFTGRITE